MTDNDENRPLSRRELRLREMAAAGLQTEPEQAAPAELPEANEHATFEVDIPPFDEDGNPRSRRQIRELREQAIAELRAAAGVKNEESSLSEIGLEQVAEIEVDPAEVVGQDAVDSEHADAHSESEPVAEIDTEAGLEEASEPEPELDPAPQLDNDVEPELDAKSDADAEGEPQVEAEPELIADAVGESALETEAEPKGELESEAESAPTPTQSYSFPDIAPLDEGQSIFDDPALQVVGADPLTGSDDAPRAGDFDDLITRAVAQESATSSTNTSALILPTMPDSDSLTGSIGETGELFITGSFDLPKSLSETGGHSSLHDSIDAEPFDVLGLSEPTPTAAMSPVSASRAVSARSHQGPLVADVAKDKNKMPVVLIATGGVLVLGAVGLIIWAATSGLFG